MTGPHVWHTDATSGAAPGTETGITLADLAYDATALTALSLTLLLAWNDRPPADGRCRSQRRKRTYRSGVSASWLE